MKRANKNEMAEKVLCETRHKVDGWLDKTNSEITAELNGIAEYLEKKERPKNIVEKIKKLFKKL